MDEREEAWAMGLVANGDGSHPLPEGLGFDEAYVAFQLEDLDRISVFLRKDGSTLRAYHFRLVPAHAPAGEGENPEGGEA